LLTLFGALGAALTLALYFFPLRLFREEDLVRHFARRSITAVEAERLRLSRELHDGVGQSIGAVALTLARLEARTGASAETTEGARLVDGALQELRRVLQGLRPSALDDLGLTPAIDALAAEVRNAGLEVAIDLPPLPRLSPEVEHTCYRLAQEALSNVVRHSGAKHVRILVRQSPSELVLEVEDDGRGFSPTADLGMGLVGARERAAAISGVVTVKSDPSQGTRLRAVLPLLREHE
jgi:two-component system sensor histidine kinase UhpB